MPPTALRAATDHATVAHALAAHAENLSSSTALVYAAADGSEVQRSYAELYSQAADLGTVLRGLRPRTHDRPFVLIALPNGVDYVTSFFACLLADAVAVTFHPPSLSTTRAGRAYDHRLMQLLRDCEPSAVLAEAALHERVRRVSRAAQLDPVVLDPADVDGAASSAGPRTRPDHLALLQYTSGSTSSPKGVMVSNANLVHNVTHMSRNLGTGPGQAAAGWLPLFHDMGLIGMVCHPLWAGMNLHMSTPTGFLRNPLGWLKTLTATRASFTIAPDFGYATATQKVPAELREGLDLSALRHALNGAEPVRPKTIAAFSKAYAPHGFDPHAMMPAYGLAEATLVVTCLDRQAAPALAEVPTHALGSGRQAAAASPSPSRVVLVGCGQALSPDTEVAVVDPATAVRTPAGKVGEIWISGPSVADGYWGHEEASREVFQATVSGPDDDGRRYLRTGDLGVWHDGQLCVVGRIKDVIVHRGANHYPQDLEATVEESHPLVARAAAFTVRSGPESDEHLVLVSELTEYGGQVDYAAITGAIRTAVHEEHGVPPLAVELLRAGAVPRTTSGKVRRQEAARQWSAGEFNPVAGWRRGGMRKGEQR